MAGLRGSALGPRSLTPPGPVPGSLAPLPPPSLTLGTLSNCTKVAVPVLPHTRAGSLLPVLSPPPPPLLLSRTISLFLLTSFWVAQLCVCVCFGGGVGSGWSGFAKGPRKG